MSFSDNAIRRKCGGGIPLLKIWGLQHALLIELW
jgi:hypothetical protein